MSGGGGGSNGGAMLQQMAYHCPGLHGPGCSQRIERRTFGDFLDAPKETARVIIPLFQRRYCWEDVRVSGWFSDVVAGKRDHLGVHNSGNVVVVRDASAGTLDNSLDWILVDGQQRMTTTSLLLAAFRDAALKEGEAEELVAKLERILYHDRAAARLYRPRKVEEGEDLKFCRLVPSLYDRRAFFTAVTEGLTQVDLVHAEDADSFQMKAKRYFDAQVKMRLNSVGGSDPSARRAELESISDLALHKMGLTLVDVRGEVNLAQVFLWLQEKTLFGEAALLFNPSPGVDFSAADLTRNLVLATVMDKALEEQVEFYRERWLLPIESKCDGTVDLTEAISEYVEGQLKKVGSSASRHVSKLEETVLEVRKKFPKGKGVLDHAGVYSRFFSLYESRLRSAAMLPPRQIKKFEQPGMKKLKKEEEEKDLSELVDAEAVAAVALNMLGEMADHVGARKKKAAAKE